MRRSDREITDRAQISAFIGREKIMRVGFNDGGEVYIVPVNYGFDCVEGEYTFYFHGAKAGRKYELAKVSPEVGFEIDGGYELISAETACGHSAGFMSVIGTGRLMLTEDGAQKTHALERIMEQAAGRSGWTFGERETAETAVFALRAEKLTCKAK